MNSSSNQPPNPLDQAAPTRPGEELDAAKLAAYLRTALPDLDGELVIEQFPGGHSNLTYLLRIGENELVLRRPPFGAQIKSAHDMGREYGILSKLVQVYPRVPRPLAYCEDASVLGAPFYIMERVRGVVLRASPPPGLDLSAAVMQSLSEAFVDNLATIHALDYKTAGLGELGKPDGYVQRQIGGWTKRYQAAQTDALPQIEAVAEWLAANMPAESGAALIHNDYKYDNLVLDPDNLANILGVLDWEMATLGDPLMDLGCALGYWVDPDDPPEMQALAFGLTTRPGNLSRRQLAERYAQQSGRDIGNLLFYYVYALFKIAVIVQQIYARYKSGHSQDERFAAMIEGVKVMGGMAVRAIEAGRVDRLGRGTA
ncbi:MAG: phosphotransferase family protein [Anaerolineae bacterium]|nr:phosphotransferase family protein [Anaerolineae bacterium]